MTEGRRPPKITLLSRAAQVLTLADGPLGPRAGDEQAALGLREQYSVVLQDDVIAWCGPADTLDRAGIDAGSAGGRGGEVEEIDCRGRVIMPALVDSQDLPLRAVRKLMPDGTFHSDTSFGSQTLNVGGKEVPVLAGHEQVARNAATTSGAIQQRAIQHATVPHLQVDVDGRQLHIFIQP